MFKLVLFFVVLVIGCGFLLYQRYKLCFPDGIRKGLCALKKECGCHSETLS